MFESLRNAAYPAGDGASAEDQPSELARGAALLRALAAVDEREEIRGGDYLAEIFLEENRKNSLNDPVIKEWLIKNYIPYGIYAYSVARTAYFDHLVEQALRDNVPQIVFLGAGYDSRSYRFNSLIGETRIFELDDKATQQRKRELLRQAGIAVPEKLSLVPVSEGEDVLKDGLEKAGYDKGRQTLFVCEGITYYLTTKEVDEIFALIKSGSPPGSTVCFDYKCLSPGMADHGGLNDLKELMGAENAAETAGFGIEEGKLGIFLAERELMVLEQLSADELEERYLKLRDGSIAAKVASQYRVAYASLSG